MIQPQSYTIKTGIWIIAHTHSHKYIGMNKSTMYSFGSMKGEQNCDDDTVFHKKYWRTQLRDIKMSVFWKCVCGCAWSTKSFVNQLVSACQSADANRFSHTATTTLTTIVFKKTKVGMIIRLISHRTHAHWVGGGWHIFIFLFWFHSSSNGFDGCLKDKKNRSIEKLVGSTSTSFNQLDEKQKIPAPAKMARQ